MGKKSSKRFPLLMLKKFWHKLSPNQKKKTMHNLKVRKNFMPQIIAQPRLPPLPPLPPSKKIIVRPFV